MGVTARAPSLAAMLTAVEDALPRALLPPGGLEAMRAAVAELPFVPLLALECHLGPLPHRVDVQTGELAGDGALASHLGGATGGRITRADLTAGGRFAQLVETVWLEFDVVPREGAGTPAFFAGIRPGAEAGADALIELAHAMLGDLDESTAAALRRCIAAVDGETEITHLGAMCGRRDRPLRVNIGARDAAALHRYADAAALKAPRRDALGALLRAVEPSVHHYLLAVDLAGEIRPRFGVECYLRVPDDLTGWRAVLDRFVALRACERDEAEAVLRWPGRADGDASVVRTLNHLKLVCEPGAPLAAKAYFLAQREERTR